MTKTLVILATFFSLSAAQADIFSCELKSDYGFVRAKAEAYNGVKQALAQDGEFSCEGLVVGQETQVRVTSLITGEMSSASERASKAQVELTALNSHLDMQDTVICTCGMN